MRGEYALEVMGKGKRIDGRKFDEFRKIVVEKGVIKNAEGSARVKIGETEVIAGVKLEITKPFPDNPKEGVLIVNAEFTPLASPDFESGPPGEDAIELARIVDRGIREGKCIKLDELCIQEGEKVWGVFIDIHTINEKGNLLNASALASMAALLNTKIPKLEGDKVLRGEFERDLPVEHRVVNVTVCRVGENYLIDPAIEEEEIVESKLSVSVREDGKICAIQKQGSKELDFDEIEKMVNMAIEKSKEIGELI